MNFVLIGLPRTGSTYLVSLLNTQNDILCNGEIFLPELGKGPLRWARKDRDDAVIAELTALRDHNPRKFVKLVFAQNYGRKAVGFKMFLGQNDAVLERLVLDHRIKKVVLLRHNMLAAFSSGLIARQTGARWSTQAEVSEPKDQPKKPLAKFNEARFRSFCERYAAFYREIFGMLNETKQVFHLINYEQINDPWHFASLVAFLGAEQSDARPKSNLSKMNSSDIVSRFSNPGAVRAFLLKEGLMGWQYEAQVTLDPFGTAAQAGEQTPSTGETPESETPESTSPESPGAANPSAGVHRFNRKFG